MIKKYKICKLIHHWGDKMKEEKEIEEIEKLLRLKKERPVVFKLYTLRQGIELKNTKEGWEIRRR